MATIRVGKMADLMGVTPQTIRKWVRNGAIPSHTLPSGQFIFTEDDVKEALGEAVSKREQIWVHYARSSSGRAASLQNQAELLEKRYGTPWKLVKDSGSGLNENRKGLNKLIKLAQTGDFTDLAVTTEDRLSRFGVSYLEALFAQNGVEIHVMNPTKDKEPQEERENE